MGSYTRTNGEPMTPLTAVSEQILQTGGALVSVCSTGPQVLAN